MRNIVCDGVSALVEEAGPRLSDEHLQDADGEKNVDQDADADDGDVVDVLVMRRREKENAKLLLGGDENEHGEHEGEEDKNIVHSDHRGTTPERHPSKCHLTVLPQVCEMIISPSRNCMGWVGANSRAIAPIPARRASTY